jgi:hypothetical protein
MSDAAPRVPLPKFLIGLAVTAVMAVVGGVVLPIGGRSGPDQPPSAPASTPVPWLTGPPFLPTR